VAQTLPNPITAAMLTPANANAGYPRYNTPGDWSGAVVGDDVDVATANVALATASGAAAYPDYAPRHQAAKAAAMVPGPNNPAFVIVTDVARPRGWIAPSQPYQGNATPPAAPAITSLSPNTAVAGTGAAIVVDITGTGFTPWSTVLSGNYPIPSTYISPTLIRIGQYPRNSVAGTVQVVVIDHDVNSAPSNFTFT
jgi:IPT/TIG domain